MRPKVTDEELIAASAEGITHAEIAERFGVSRAAVSQRLALIERDGAKSLAPSTSKAIAKSVYDIGTFTENVYQRSLVLLDKAEEGESIPTTQLVLSELRKLIGEARAQVELIREVEYQLDWQNTLLRVLGRVAPEARREFVMEIQGRWGSRAMLPEITDVPTGQATRSPWQQANTDSTGRVVPWRETYDQEERERIEREQEEAEKARQR